MKNSRMLVAMVMVFVFAFLSGCSSFQSKPSAEIQRSKAVDSFIEMLMQEDYAKGIIHTPHHGPLRIRDMDIDSKKPQFLSEPVIKEKVNKRDKNGVERKMWVVEINVKAKINYKLDFMNEVEPYCRIEQFKYKMFLYKDGKDYVFENGVLEDFTINAV